MHPLIAAALAEAEPLVAGRGWTAPSLATLADADRLLALLGGYRPPLVNVEPDGSVRFEWEAGEHGWLSLTVNGRGQLMHSAVIGQDEFEQTESFADVLPDWAASLLSRLSRAHH